jgi:lysyl-tRNA synthetase class 1
MKVMLKSLREERAADLFDLPAACSPETGHVLYVPIKHVDREGHTVTFDDETGREWTVPVTGGNVQAAVEARFRRALGRAGRRFRDVWQGPFDEHADLRRDLRDPGRPRRRHFTYELFR